MQVGEALWAGPCVVVHVDWVSCMACCSVCESCHLYYLVVKCEHALCGWQNTMHPFQFSQEYAHTVFTDRQPRQTFCL